MQAIMAICAVLCFGFAFFVARNGLVSDLQLILLAQGVIGGVICLGLAVVLQKLRWLSARTAGGRQSRVDRTEPH